MKTSAAILAAVLLNNVALAEDEACPTALEELEFSLKGSELPSQALLERIEDNCPESVSRVVEEEVTALQMIVLSTQVAFLDANRIESYAELEAALDSAGKGKKRSGNQAFGTVLQTLRPVLAVHLERNLYD